MDIDGLIDKSLETPPFFPRIPKVKKYFDCLINNYDFRICFIQFGMRKVHI